MPAQRFTMSLEALASWELHTDAWDNQITAVQLIGKNRALVVMTAGKTIPNLEAEIQSHGAAEVPDV